MSTRANGEGRLLPLLVGESNPFGGPPKLDLWPEPENCSGGRLARILGLSRTEYLRRFRRVNLCRGPWRLAEARAATGALLEQEGVLILLGARVARAFRLPSEPFRCHQGIYVLPHPSGRCRVWNDPVSVDRARGMLAEFLR